jgi:predicted homoserine dehydrogenase-like protein
MIIIDRALQARAEAGRPLRVAMFGAGFMGRAIARQIIRSVPGIRLDAIVNRTPEKARRAFVEAGSPEPHFARSAAELEDAISRGHPVIAEDPSVVCGSESIEAIIEVTGSVEYAAAVVLRAVETGKHVVLMNAEVDATVGPALQAHARHAGAVLTACDGDQPGVEMNLYRFVKSAGLTPLVCGNVKGFHDPYRTPETQAGYAAEWGQDSYMVTSFADGTKVSFEQAIVANGTGMGVGRRGMSARRFDGHVDDLVHEYDVDELRAVGGVVDYVIGARPAPGVFVLAAEDDAEQRRFLKLFKLGDGPLYSFYVPYHLCHFEVPNTVARAVLFGDAALAPLDGPVVEVVATAKRDLAAGETLDGIGGFTTYGQCENAAAAARERLLPMGVAEGCRLRRPVARDAVLSYDDVDLPGGRLVDRLRLEQAALTTASSV